MSIRDLAASVGAGSFHHVSAPTQPVGERLVALPEQWRPELPAEDRYDLEAAAIAGWTRTPWQVFLGRTATRPAPDPDRQLTRLCAAADLIRLALGLGLVVTVTVQNHRPGDGDPLRLRGGGWNVEINAPALPVGGPVPPIHPTIETAIADALEYLDLALAEAVPADPRYPIPVPSAPQPAPVPDPLPLLTQLGDRYAGQPVVVRFDPAGCHVHLVASAPSPAQWSVPTVTAGTRPGRGPARSASSGR